MATLFADREDPQFDRFLSPLRHWLGADGEPGDILALGPLTNLAVLALARPDLLANIGTLVWMGGAVGRGNHTPSAEFNAFADPEAVQILLDRGVSMRVLDLDACRKVLITEEDVAVQARCCDKRGDSGPAFGGVSGYRVDAGAPCDGAL